MKNNSLCVMITGTADDSFTGNELPYLAANFRRVHVFALNKRHGRPYEIIFPENVRVHQIDVTSGLWRVPKYLVAGLFSRQPDLPFLSLSLRRIIARLYARGRSKLIFDFILSELQNEECPFGVIYSYWFTDQAIAAWKVAEEFNRRGNHFSAVSRAHGYDLYWERNVSGYLPYQDVSLKHLAGVYPCSAHGAAYLSRKYPQYVHKIRVARLGTKDFGLGPEPNGRKTFATCCLFEPLKRMPLFAEAFCQMWLKDKELRWYCIGDGPDLMHTKEIVSRYRANEAVLFLGRMKNEQLMEFYKTTPISYFVNVSTTEGVPVSIMEAISFGIPVIATDVGGSGELVSSKCGALIASDITQKDLSFALCEMIALDTKAYRLLRDAARNVWETKASLNNNLSDLITTIASK